MVLIKSNNTVSVVLLLAGAMQIWPACTDKEKPELINGAVLHNYVERFNVEDPEFYVNAIPNERAEVFLKNNIPLFECPDKEIERTSYYRWWTYRKHIKATPDGYVVTEFLPNVSWAKKHNTINGDLGHHLYEGRWLHDHKYLDDYLHFYNIWDCKCKNTKYYSYGITMLN